jgi:triacylglycerol lipase
LVFFLLFVIISLNRGVVMEKYKTKYPIVLVHGMVLKDFKIYRAFRKIRDVLKHNNISVYVTTHDGIGTIENNALQIKKEIIEILEKENVDKVNIIAHSKGGLDSRYMISKLNMDEHVASLTTLSTPHRGSKLSTKLLSMPKWCAKFLAFWINLFYKIHP